MKDKATCQSMPRKTPSAALRKSETMIKKFICNPQIFIPFSGKLSQVYDSAFWAKMQGIPLLCAFLPTEAGILSPKVCPGGRYAP